MKKALLLTAFLLALAASPADARSISPSKAKKFLQTQLPELSQEIAEEVAKENAGVTLVNSQVNDCKKKKRRVRVDCDLAFTFRPPNATDFSCELRVKVTYKSKRSKKLTTDVASDKVRCKDA